jgi:hypothetical protein
MCMWRSGQAGAYRPMQGCSHVHVHAHITCILHVYSMYIPCIFHVYCMYIHVLHAHPCIRYTCITSHSLIHILEVLHTHNPCICMHLCVRARMCRVGPARDAYVCVRARARARVRACVRVYDCMRACAGSDRLGTYIYMRPYAGVPPCACVHARVSFCVIRRCTVWCQCLSACLSVCLPACKCPVSLCLCMR